MPESNRQRIRVEGGGEELEANAVRKILLYITGWFEPVAMTDLTKFSKIGGCSELMSNKWDLPARARRTIEELGNFGLSQNTWSSYRTAKRMWDLCKTETGFSLDFPWGQRETIIFIDWLVNDRKVAAATIKSYLAGISKFHILEGFEEPNLKTQLVKQIVKGKLNKEKTLARSTGDQGRIAVTIDILKLLKEMIRRWDQPIEKKLLVWAVVTIAFFGGFRIHEILAKNETFFDPTSTLLWDDIRTTTFQGLEKNTLVLELTIKAPKETKACRDVVVDIFEVEGPLCPVKAFNRWATKSSTSNKPGPVFRDESGVPLTGRKLNFYLKKFLENTIDYNKEKITSHSFRSGLATLIGSKGMSIEEIKIAGRWNSSSYEKYLKLPRAQRALLAQKLGTFAR